MPAFNFILAIGFFTPWLMGMGAAATSIPIVIHLLNKRRFKVVVWAAMDFLLAAHRRNARRLKFQRWLLLALRVLAILVLAMAIAQLYLSCSANSVIGQTFGGGKKVIIVMDDSYSMGWAKKGDKSAFEFAKEKVVDYLGRLSPGDKALVILTSEAGTSSGLKLLDPRKAVEMARGMQVSDSGTDLAAALTAAADVLSADNSSAVSRRVILVTDLSRSSLPTEAPGVGGGAVPAPLKSAAAKVQQVAGLQVADFGGEEQSNLAISNAVMKDPIAVAEEDVKIEATIYNGTNEIASDVAVTVVVDGIKRPMENLPRIEPGRESSFITSVKFPSPGPHNVEFQIKNDQLPLDDVRRMVIDVQRNIPLLVVDGKPSDGQSWSSTWSVQAMASAFGGYGATAVTDAQLGSVAINKQKVILFSDAVAPSAAAVTAITDFVRAGGLLIIFPGDQTISNSLVWRDRMGSRGAGLLPSDFGPVQEPKTEAFPDGVELDPLEYAHPSLKMYGEAIRAGKKFLIQSYKTKRYFQLALPTGDDAVETVMRFRKDDGSLGGDPAILTRRFGRGRVVQFAMGLGSEWSGLTSGAGDFPPLLDQLIKTELSGGTDKFTMLVGDSLDLASDVAAPGSWNAPHNTKVGITREPKRGATVTTAPATAPADKPAERIYSSGALSVAGFYGPEGGSPVVAVNPDGAEADIRHVTPVQFGAAMQLDAKFILSKTLESTLVAGGSLEETESIGRQLLIAALVLFVIETILARVFSVYR